MALIEEMENSGAWLFRWRSYLPLFALIVLVVLMKDFSYPYNDHHFDMIWELFCLSISFMGLGIRALTIGQTPRRTSGRNTKKQVAESLNTTGIYSLVRHPLYLELSNWHVAKPLRFVFIFSFLKAKPKV